jgi:rhodanese-related sulfurtransferase
VGGEDDGGEERKTAAMNLNPAHMSRNAKLGLLVCLLGLFAAFAGSPYKGARVTIDAVDLAGIVQREVDHIDPIDLADSIIEGKSDYRLIDLRTQAEYDQYHIPSAVNVPLAALPDYRLERNQKIILYSEGGIHSAQAWFLLKAMGYKSVYMLRGGLDEWQDTVLFPSLPPNPSWEQLSTFAKMKEVSKFFGGTPQTEATAKSPDATRQLPKLQMSGEPSEPATTHKKKKEGC